MNDDTRLDCSDMEQSSDLKRLSTLADSLAKKQRLVLRVEARLKRAQRSVQDLEEGLIPELMEDLGMESFRTLSGLSVSIAEHVHASIAEASKPKAFAWFEQNGEGGLIRRAVTIAFNREQTDMARKLADELRAVYPGVKEDASVHPSTLKAWVSRRLREGEEIPEGITVHTVKSAKIEK